MVGPILLGKCSDKNWKVVMKALYVIQEVLNAANTDGFKAYFKENNEEIQMLANYNHPMVKKLSAAVADLIARCGVDGEEGEEAAEDDFEPRTAAPAPAAAPASNDPFGFSGVGDINSAFSGLTASQPAQPVQRPQPAPQPAQPSGFDFFGAPAQPAQPVQQPMNFGMGMQQPAQQPAMNYGMPAQQPAQQQPAAMNFDFFGM